jgi:uncharacterized protein (TIGR00297 family)
MLFLVLLTVFVLTLIATRVGKARKQELDAAESIRGRSASQVIANLGIALLVVAVRSNQDLLLAIAVMAEVAADTCSSEIGLAFPGRTVLLTSWKPVPPGVDGGISLHGTGAALISSAAISVTAGVLHLVTLHQVFTATAAGFAGMLIDSLLGALFERRGFLNNDAVNVLSTAAAAALGFALS